MRLAVVVGKFPAVSETFVSRQALDLMRLGHEVDVYANRRGDQAVGADDELAPLAARLRLRPKRGLSGLARTGSVVARPALAMRLCNPFRYGSDALSLRLLFSAVPFVGLERYDAVLAHFGPNASVAAKLRDAGVAIGPLVSIFHGSDVESARRGQFEFLFRTGERFIAVSRALEARLAEQGAPRERVHVVYNGVDLARFGGGGAGTGSEGGPLRLVSVARLVPVKGLEHAIAAINELPAPLRGSVRYDIVGDGPLRASLQQKIDERGLGAIVRLRGALAHDQIPEALAGADVFLFPSLSEGLGVAAIEAMASGLPVIGSRIGGIPEVVADGRTGLLVGPEDAEAIAAAIVRLSNDPALRAEMGKAGRARACELFDAGAQLRRLMEVIELARDRRG